SGPAIPSERDVHVLAQPAPERDVPPVPEIRHAVRRVGTIEVLGDARAEQSAEADRHVGPAREAEIEEEVQLRPAPPEAKISRFRLPRKVTASTYLVLPHRMRPSAPGATRASRASSPSPFQ